jgi:UDP-4-amino-4,6-dideoxy-N-acetyl-beta-L-altrosamine transaminase
VIPYGRQTIDDEDVAAVAAVLRSDFLTQGPAVPALEAALTAQSGAAHAVAMNSATSALHVACLALGVGPGDRVWTTPVTFVASANCALYCGAEVDFVDIDPGTFNLSVERLAEKLEAASAQGRLPKVVIPVHLAGQSCDMAGIRTLADQYGFGIVEDASHAVGARYRDAAVGACAYSDIAVFSFHPVKIVTTGEGGAALTNDSALAEKMALLRSHGITRDEARMEGASHGPWYYEQVDLGFNYRMTDLQAALGVSQMGRIESFLERRRAHVAAYDEAFRNQPLTLQAPEPGAESSHHLYIVHLGGGDRDRHRRAFEALRERGIGVNLHYIPVYLQPYYRRLGFAPGYCPAAEHYYAGAISLPMYPGLTAAERDYVAETVIAVARA